jgi:hypothetical protein
MSRANRPRADSQTSVTAAAATVWPAHCANANSTSADIPACLSRPYLRPYSATASACPSFSHKPDGKPSGPAARVEQSFRSPGGRQVQDRRSRRWHAEHNGEHFPFQLMPPQGLRRAYPGGLSPASGDEQCAMRPALTLYPFEGSGKAPWIRRALTHRRERSAAGKLDDA